MKLDSVIDSLAIETADSEVIAEECARKYGIGADEVLEEKERRIEVLDCLKVILSFLSKTQRDVLLLVGAGYSLTDISAQLGITTEAVRFSRNSIPNKITKEVNDKERVGFLEAEIARLSKNSRGRHSQLYADFVAELERRKKLKESLPKIKILMTPPQSTLEADGKLSMPAYTFERVMQIGEGMREGIQDGRKVMKTIVKCRLPEYVNEAFGDKCTCCTLCATCTRKKDVIGRAGFDKYGLEKPAQF